LRHRLPKNSQPEPPPPVVWRFEPAPDVPDPPGRAVVYAYANHFNREKLQPRMQAAWNYAKSRFKDSPQVVVEAELEDILQLGHGIMHMETESRPAWRRVYDGMKPGDHLIVSDLEQIYAGGDHFVRMMNWLKHHGARLHIVDFNGRPVEMGTPWGDASLSAIGVFAALPRSQRPYLKSNPKTPYYLQKKDGKVTYNYSVRVVMEKCLEYRRAKKTFAWMEEEFKKHGLTLRPRFAKEIVCDELGLRRLKDPPPEMVDPKKVRFVGEMEYKKLAKMFPEKKSKKG
jgi:hypothetical protein